MTEADDKLYQSVKTLDRRRAAHHAMERVMLAFIAVCVVGIAALLLQQNLELSREIKNQQQAASARTKFLKTNEQDIKNETTDIKTYIQCIAEFYAQPNRTNLTIADLPNCKIDTAAGTETSLVLPESTPTVTPAKPQTSNPNAQQPTTSAPPPEPSNAAQQKSASSTSTNKSTANPISRTLNLLGL